MKTYLYEDSDIEINTDPTTNVDITSVFFSDSTARKNIHNNLYKKQDYLFYTIIV
jgi:hypothetical protein